MTTATTHMLKRRGVTIAVTNLGGDGLTVLLLHGLAGSSRELLPTGRALEGHVAGSSDPEEATALGRWFASWPTPFPDEATARAFLGEEAIADAWVADLETTPQGLMPRFDADIMQRTLEAVHEPRWSEWESLQVPTLAIFAARGMFSEQDKDELVRRRPSTTRIDLRGGSHDAHLDAFHEWADILTHSLA